MPCDGRQISQALTNLLQNAVDSIGKNWMLLTNDYVWGHTTSAPVCWESHVA